MAQGTSDEDFRAFAAEYLLAEPSAHFGPILEKWRQYYGAYIPLRDSLLDIFEQERRRVSGHRPLAPALTTVPPAPTPSTPAAAPRWDAWWMTADSFVNKYLLNRHAFMTFVVVSVFGVVWPNILWDLLAPAYRHDWVPWAALAFCTPLACVIALAIPPGGRMSALAGGMCGQFFVLLSLFIIWEASRHGP
jgi:hypothetical protein